jgi:hypothetical protein
MLWAFKDFHAIPGISIFSSRSMKDAGRCLQAVWGKMKRRLKAALRYFPFPHESRSATVRLKTAFSPGMWSFESAMK